MTDLEKPKIKKPDTYTYMMKQISEKVNQTRREIKSIDKKKQDKLDKTLKSIGSMSEKSEQSIMNRPSNINSIDRIDIIPSNDNMSTQGINKESNVDIERNEMLIDSIRKRNNKNTDTYYSDEMRKNQLLDFIKNKINSKIRDDESKDDKIIDSTDNNEIKNEIKDNEDSVTMTVNKPLLNQSKLDYIKNKINEKIENKLNDNNISKVESKITSPKENSVMMQLIKNQIKVKIDAMEPKRVNSNDKESLIYVDPEAERDNTKSMIRKAVYEKLNKEKIVTKVHDFYQDTVDTNEQLGKIVNRVKSQNNLVMEDLSLKVESTIKQKFRETYEKYTNKKMEKSPKSVKKKYNMQSDEILKKKLQMHTLLTIDEHRNSVHKNKSLAKSESTKLKDLILTETDKFYTTGKELKRDELKLIEDDGECYKQKLCYEKLSHFRATADLTYFTNSTKHNKYVVTNTVPKTFREEVQTNKRVFKDEVFNIEFSKRMNSNKKWIPSNSTGFANEMSKNRLASKFNPDSLYTLKNIRSKSSGAITIVRTEDNLNTHIISNMKIHEYLVNMDSGSQYAFRYHVLRDFAINKQQKRELRELSLRLINYIKPLMLQEEMAYYMDIEKVVVKFACNQFPTELLSRMMQIFSYKINGEFKLNMIQFSYALYFHTVDDAFQDCYQSLKFIISTIPFTQQLISFNFNANVSIKLYKDESINLSTFTNVFDNKMNIIFDDDNSMNGIFNENEIIGVIFSKKNYSFKINRVHSMNPNEMIYEGDIFLDKKLCKSKIVESMASLILRFKLNQKMESVGNIRFVIKNVDRELEKNRMTFTLKNIFLNEFLQTKLVGQISNMYENSLQNKVPVTRQYLLQYLTDFDPVKNLPVRYTYDMVKEMKEYLNGFLSPSYYSDRELMQKFKNKIIIGKSYGNVNMTVDTLSINNTLDNLAREMTALRELKKKSEALMGYKTDILF